MTTEILILNVALMAIVVVGVVGLLAWSIAASMNPPIQLRRPSRRTRIQADLAEVVLHETAQRVTSSLPLMHVRELGR